jgi:hypothetical protein
LYAGISAVVILSVLACFAAAHWILDRKVTVTRVIAVGLFSVSAFGLAKFDSSHLWNDNAYILPVVLLCWVLISTILVAEGRTSVIPGSLAEDGSTNATGDRLRRLPTHVLFAVPRSRLFGLVVLCSALPAATAWTLKLIYAINRNQVPNIALLAVGARLVITWASNLVWLTGIALKSGQEQIQA